MTNKTTFTEEELFYYNEKLIQDYNESLKYLDHNDINMFILADSFIGEGEKLERFISELRIAHASEEKAAYDAYREYLAEQEQSSNNESIIVALQMEVHSETPIKSSVVEEFTIISQSSMENELDFKLSNGNTMNLPLADSKFYVNEAGKLIISTQFTLMKKSEEDQAELKELFNNSYIAPYTIKDDDSDVMYSITVKSFEVVVNRFKHL